MNPSNQQQPPAAGPGGAGQPVRSQRPMSFAQQSQHLHHHQQQQQHQNTMEQQQQAILSGGQPQVAQQPVQQQNMQPATLPVQQQRMAMPQQVPPPQPQQVQPQQVQRQQVQQQQVQQQQVQQQQYQQQQYQPQTPQQQVHQQQVHQQQLVQQQPPNPGGSQTGGEEPAGEGPAAQSTPQAFGHRLKGLFNQSSKPSNAPNYGFTPTAAMVQRHEDVLVSSKRPIYQFQVTKLRTWRTGYLRLLCLYDSHISTIDPDNHQITNTWNYNTMQDFMAVADKDQFLLQFGDKDKLKFECHQVDKSHVLTSILQCHDEFLMQKPGKEPQDLRTTAGPIALCQRWTRHGIQVPSALRVTSYALVEVHPSATTSNNYTPLQIYAYVDIVAISFTSDDPKGLILHFGSKSTTRLFSLGSNARSEVVTAMRQAYNRIGLELRMTDSMKTMDWKQKRHEQMKKGRHHTIATEYAVTKESRRHNVAIVGGSSMGQAWAGGVVNRTLCLTGSGTILEKDASGLIVSSRSLQDLYAIVRPASAGDKIQLEFHNGQATTRTYSTSSRDSLIVSLLDAAATLGKNPQVHISDVTGGGYCLSSTFAKGASTAEAPASTGGLFQPISIPVHCLKRVHSVATAAFSYLNSTTESSTEEGKAANPMEECRNVLELCREFNASVLPTAHGLPTSEKDKYVLGSVGALWGLTAELLERGQRQQDERHLAEQTAAPMFQTLHRLSKTPAGYKHSVELATLVDCLPLLWTIEDAFCKFWAFRALTVLLSGLQPPVRQTRDKEVEYVNKSVIFKAGGLRFVHGLVNSLLSQKVSDLIRMVMSDIMQSVLCSYADTTSPEHFGALIQALGENYQALLHTLYQQTPFVIENTALLLHLLSTHAPAVAAAIRAAALSSAILLHHFHAAIFSPMEGQRFLSRFLCSLWLSGPKDCDEKKLLQRVVPHGFLGYLKMPALSRVEEEQLDSLERDAVEENIPEEASAMSEGAATTLSASLGGTAGTNSSRLRSRVALARATAPTGTGLAQGHTSELPENFRIFFHVLTQNHSLPDLIWNQQTRRELRIGLESEIQYIQRETESRGIDKIAWNHQQFGIDYPSLDNELRVGSIYMRLWLQAGEGFIKSWDEPLRLFELLFRRFLCEMDRNTKVTVMCIRCLERLYSIHGTSIGAFPDVMILIRSMASTRSTETQHRLLALLATILGVQRDEKGDESSINVPENAEQLLNTESIEQLCQFVAWGHTNGVQVGNLLTSVLQVDGYSHSGRAMLTDGSEMKPEGEGNTAPAEPQQVARDISCPPVWFTASTVRIPPPPESIKGPYRVSELQKLLDEGDLSPFSLVTSTVVDNYDDEENAESTAVTEGQIDTGKWRRLDQVWQLRWQLCTDGTGTGIYSPSEVALRAIRSLTRLVDLHKSLDYRGLPFYPIPIAKRIMCGLSRDPFRKSGEEGMDRQESFLSILTQSVLCNDPNVVDQAADLLLKLTQYNEEATSKFYLTGIYFFIASYTGSNFKGLAKLLHTSHLKQHFRSGFAAAADNSELPLKERSILGSLLPEGVLFMLVNYGVERFNEVFVGNFDTPEVIWNFEMRKHLIEMVRQHLGDFPKRLWQNTTTKYDYCPIPGVAYQRLEKEIFCHNYYLHNLCDEARFPDWPIAEPVEVFRACLEEFKKQINRDETEEVQAVGSAAKVLDLQPGDGSRELRKAYRSLARKYHPDRNPAGREKFEEIQTAYELLMPILESGQKIQDSMDKDGGASLGQGEGDAGCAEDFAGGMLQMQAMQLLIRSQALICRRFEAEMSKYKYPAYKILLTCLTLPPTSRNALSTADAEAILSDRLMRPKRAEFVRDTVELVFRTCLVSPLNAEELVSESGVLVLVELLDFYIVAASCLDPTNANGDRASDTTVSEILSNIIHTIGGIAFYESGRAAIVALNGLQRFCINWRRCIDGKHLGKRMKEVGDSLIKRYALEGVANMARDSDLQNELVGAGIVWPLVRFLLAFDPTLDEGSMSRDTADDDIGVSQAASNTHARLATRALGMLSGALRDPALSTPKNPDLQRALDALLTSPVALLLRNKRTGEILRTLNANVETPSRIWNVEMRAELLKFVEKVVAERPEAACRPVADEYAPTAGFAYSALKDELQVGGVYVRIFNQLGVEKGALRDISNPTLFAKQLIDCIASCINESMQLPQGWVKLSLSSEVDESFSKLQRVVTADRSFVLVVTALRILVRSEGLIDDVLCEEATNVPSVLLSLLELPQESEAFEIGCDILTTVSPKEQFADSVAAQGSLWRLLWVLERLDAKEKEESQEGEATSSQSDILRKQRGWMLLESLSSSPSVAMKIVESTAWMELLGILVGYSGFTKIWIARIGAAKTLSRLLWDPKTGPIVAPLLQQFLPATLSVVLKEEGAENMLNLFDGESDTPELIWDGSMRGELRKVIGRELDSCIEARSKTGAGNDTFSLDSGVRVKYTKLEDELFIGGVYVSRFLKEPTYSVRDPTAFLEMLMQRWTHELHLCTTHEATKSDSTSTELSLGGQDTLQTVTNASVYLCKIRDNLCEKLSQWGYMARSLELLDSIISRRLMGTPLLSVMRILHVAVGRRPNVEALILSGKNDQLNGIVPFTIQVIGIEELHNDTAFFVEMLKKLFLSALGDVKNAKTVKSRPDTTYTVPVAHAMAPSPAPGEGPVSRNRVSMGNPLDDPLAMAPPPASAAGPGVRPGSVGGQQFAAMQAPTLPHPATTTGLPHLGGPSQPQSNPGVYNMQQTVPYSGATFAGGYPQQSSSQGGSFQSNYGHPMGQQTMYQGSYGTAGYNPPMHQFQQAQSSFRGPAQQPTPGHSSFSGQPHAAQNHMGGSWAPMQPPSMQSQSYQPQPANVADPVVGLGTGTTQQAQTMAFQPSPPPQQPVNQGQSVQRDLSRQVPIPSSARQVPHQPPQQVPSQIDARAPQVGQVGSQWNSQPRPPTQAQHPPSHTGLDQEQRLHMAPTAVAGNQSTAGMVNAATFGQPANSAAVRVETVPSEPSYLQAPVPTVSSATSNLQQGLAVDVQANVKESTQQGQAPIVDARTSVDPEMEAEQKAKSSPAAPGAADGRVALLESAIACQLPKFIVETVLENETLMKVKDPAAVKVHSVELLKLIAGDPGYGMKFQLILDQIPSWKKYKTQDHSLFITGPEQKADYFLTDGGTGEPQKLLTQE